MYKRQRLGCYIITNLLPKLDIRCDILLTTNEECGCSTAEEFTLTSSKEYNWVVGFDRAGEDAVLYSYSRQSKWKKAVGKHFTVRRGTYSDISSMTGLGVCGVNVGIGYHNQHTEYCYASLMELSRQIERFRKFHQEFKEEKFPYESYDEFELYDHDWRKYSWRYEFEDDDFLRVWECSQCKKIITEMEMEEINPTYQTCPYCGNTELIELEEVNKHGIF